MIDIDGYFYGCSGNCHYFCVVLLFVYIFSVVVFLSFLSMFAYTYSNLTIPYSLL